MPMDEEEQQQPGDGALRFRLYVAGDSPNSRQAVANFQEIRRDHFPPGARYELEVIDVLEQPGRAVADRVLVTPTLVKLNQPACHVVGNLNDTATVLLAIFGEAFVQRESEPAEAVSPEAQIRALVQQLSEVESNLEKLIADQADAIITPDGDAPILLREAQAALKQSAAHYRRLAHYDTLTGLPNRLMFSSRLEHAIAQARRNGGSVALLYLDVDRFKGINDALGHRVGDAVLVEFGRRLQRCVRSADTVARIGGDEFAVLIEGMGEPDDARRLAVKLIGAITDPMSVGGLMLHCSTSVGIAFLPQDAEEGDQLIEAADQAMYRAKTQGRGSYSFSNSQMNIDFGVVQRLETELLMALHEGGLELHYQPEVEPATGRIVAMEALLRWRHPQRGLLLPGSFMAAAEHTEVMEAIGDWVLRTACRQADQWRRAGHPVRVDINLSARELGRKDLAERIGTVYRELGIGARELDLEIEIPERLLAAATRNADALGGLLGLGISLSVDNYGRNHCPVSVLKALPFSRLKIDGTMLWGTAADSPASAVTRGLIAMGHGLGLSVGVSCIESEAQLSALRPEQCDEAQGFLFSQALPADAATRLLESETSLLH